MKTMRLTKTSTRNTLLAALMTASLLLALSVDGVVTLAQSGFEGHYDFSFAANRHAVDPANAAPAQSCGVSTQLRTSGVMPDGSMVVGGTGEFMFDLKSNYSYYPSPWKAFVVANAKAPPVLKLTARPLE